MSFPATLEEFLEKARREVECDGETDCDFRDTPSMTCDDCGCRLYQRAIAHGLEGFGHYRRCCFCYERRQRGQEPYRKLSFRDQRDIDAARAIMRSKPP